MADQKVNIVIEAKNNAKAAFNDLRGDLKQLQDDGKATKAEIAAAGAAIVGAITAIGVTAVTKFADFESAMSKVKAVTQSSTEEMKLMEAQARQLGATTVFTAKEVADAMTELGQAGFTSREIMEAVPATLDLAAAGGLGIARATEIASSTLRGFQLATSETTRVVDVMAKTAASSNASIESFGEAMKYFAPSAAAFGVSVEEASAVVGILSNAGIQGSLATRALGTSLARLAKPTKAMTTMMDELSFSAFDSEGNFKGMAGMIESLEKSLVGLTQEQRMATIAQLFGAEAIQEVNVLLAAGSGALKEYTTVLEESDGAAKEMAATMLDNLNGAFEQLSGAVDDIFISLGSMLAPAVRIVAELLTVLANALGYVLKWIQTLPGPVQTFLGVFAGLIVLLVTGVAAWASLSFALAGFGAALGTILTGVLALTGGLLPLIAIVAAFAAVIAFLYWAWTTNFLGIQDLVSSFVTQMIAFVDLLRFAWESNMYGIQDIAMTVWTGITFFIKTSLDFLKGIFKIAAGFLTGDWQMMWAGMKQAATAVFDFMIQAGQAMWAGLGEIFRIGGDLVSAAWGAIWEGIKGIAAGAWEAIKTGFVSMLNWLIGKLNAFIGAINTVSGAIEKAGGMKKGTLSLSTVPTFQHGGIVPDMDVGGIVRGAPGRDKTLIGASPGEVVLNYAGAAAVASGLKNGSGGGDLHIHLDGAQFNGSGEEFAEEVADKVWRLASPHLQRPAF